MEAHACAVPFWPGQRGAGMAGDKQESKTEWERVGTWERESVRESERERELAPHLSYPPLIAAKWRSAPLGLLHLEQEFKILGRGGGLQEPEPIDPCGPLDPVTLTDLVPVQMTVCPLKDVNGLSEKKDILQPCLHWDDFRGMKNGPFKSSGCQWESVHTQE